MRARKQTQRALLFVLLCSGDAVVFECCRRLPTALSFVMGRSRFPPGVVVDAGAFLVSEFPPLFFAQGAVAGVYSCCCFPPGVIPSGDGTTLYWIVARRLKHPFRRKGAPRGLLILQNDKLFCDAICWNIFTLCTHFESNRRLLSPLIF